MEDQTLYLVTVRGAPLSDAALASVSRAGITLVGATGGGTVAAGAPLPEPDHHYFWAHAEDGGRAMAKVQDALRDYGTYVPAGVRLGE